MYDVRLGFATNSKGRPSAQMPLIVAGAFLLGVLSLGVLQTDEQHIDALRD